jgi:hypothetical protein
MKKLLMGAIAAASFVSCNNKSSTNLTATLKCVGIGCPTITASTVDTTQHIAPTKWTFTVVSPAEIPANTKLQIEIVATDSAAIAK